jgi:hypothetical protein
MTEIYDSIGATYNTTRRAHALLDQTELDCGYRLVVGATGAFGVTGAK